MLTGFAKRLKLLESGRMFTVNIKKLILHIEIDGDTRAPGAMKKEPLEHVILQGRMLESDNLGQHIHSDISTGACSKNTL